MNNDQIPRDNSWFNSAHIVESTPPPRRSLKRPLIILGVVVAITIIIALTSSVATQAQRSLCLNTDDYEAFTGITLSDDDTLSPTTNFYADSVLFKLNSTDYDNTTNGGANGDSLLERVAALYAKLKTTSIKVKVAGSYVNKESSDLAKRRIDTIVARLTGLGVAQADITSSTPVFDQPDGTAYDDPISTQISITSSSTCQTQ